MKLTILGGGGFRVPLVYAALVSALAEEESVVDEVTLHDTDPDRVHAVVEVLRERFGTRGPALRVEGDLAAAVRGADVVFSAIRVGGLAGRSLDERASLAEGVLGQETVGAGGVLYGLRTIPVAVRIAELVAHHAPDAWVVNFTNPAGMVTEAMSAVLGDRVLGICDSPVGLFRRVARAIGVEVADAWFDYAGLNHLGWLRSVVVDGGDVLPRLLADDEALDSFEEGRLFGRDLLRDLGAIPNEYLYYFYATNAAMGVMAGADATRGEFLARQQARFYGAVGRPGAAQRWDAVRHEREVTYLADSREAAGAGDRDDRDLEGSGYERVALALMRALVTGTQEALVLNTRNRGSIAGLDADAVVEVPCLVGSHGAQPLAAGALDPRMDSLVSAVKLTERLTIRAALDGSRAIALDALASHPLVGSPAVAARILGRELDVLPELRDTLVCE